ncbi:reverse transcriptase domain-containing protein [Tanacetum coccineum]
MKSVFRICNCAENCQVKYATCTLLDDALNWWNSYVKTIGMDADYETTWEELKKMMTEEYCMRNELQKMETKLWNLSVEGTYIIGRGDFFKADQDSTSNPMAHNLMDQFVRAKVAKDANNKKKWEDEHGGNPYQQQNMRRDVVRVYAVGSSDKKGYVEPYHSTISSNFITTMVPAQFDVGTARRSVTKQETA